MISSIYPDLTQAISGYRPIPWDAIPDLGLYMDQVVTFLERQCKALYPAGERVLTPAMVNNYVKMGLVDRPVGKKYGREQLAQLLMICVLKQAASAEGLKTLLKTDDLNALYNHFCDMLSTVLSRLQDESAKLSPMTCAVRCAAFRFLTNAVLDSENTHKEDDPR